MKRLSWLLPCTWLAFGCGPPFREALFTPQSVPRYPEKEFAAGKLGIIQTTFWRRYLVAAWRYLEDRPLTPIEQAAYAPSSAQREPPSTWTNVRTERELPGSQFQWFVNCTPDAFRRADAKYAELKKSFNEREVASWKQAQDTVFSNCEKGEAIPAAEPGLPPALAREREYQIAAAHFYAMHYDEARERFLKMGDRYLAARCLIRKGEYAEAEKELIALGSPPLLGFVQAKLRPEETRSKLGERLSKGGDEVTFARTLADYEYLADRVSGNDEMSRWIAAVQGDGKGALDEWRKTKRTAWLVAVLIHAKQPEAELIAAAKRIPPVSPAYATVRHQVGRVLLDADFKEDARNWLDEALSATTLPTSAVNALKKKRMTIARSFDEWQRDLMRQPVAEYWIAGTGESDAQATKEGPLLDNDGADNINAGLPLALLRKLPKLTTLVRTREILIRGGTYDEIYTLLKTPSMSPGTYPGIDRRDAPPTGIDNYRANWWCKLDGKETYPPWLTESEKAAAEKELAALRALPTAPNWLAARAVELARQKPADPRSAEMLHLAVRATRYGCTDESTTAASKAAFQLLHRNYPKSPWAARTRHYY